MQHVGRNCLIDYKQRKGRWEKIKYTGLKRRRIGIEKFTFQNEYTFRNLDKSKNIFLEIFARSAKRLWNFQPPCSCQNAIQTWRKSKVRWNIYIYFLDFFLTTSTKVTFVRNCLLITIYSIENGVILESWIYLVAFYL